MRTKRALGILKYLHIDSRREMGLGKAYDFVVLEVVHLEDVRPFRLPN